MSEKRESDIEESENGVNFFVVSAWKKLLSNDWYGNKMNSSTV